jgi:2,3-dihydroxybiphenyl 1,2-dioxygenase
MIKSLAYLGVISPAYKEWETFGPEVMGLQHAGYGSDGAIRFRMDDVAYRLAIHPGEKNNIGYIGWSLKDEADAKALANRVAAEGIEVARSRDAESKERSVEGYYWFIDPSGFRQELSWGHLHTVVPFRPGRAMSGFRTGEQGLGHVVLAVEDLEKSDRFYREVMGFHPSDVVKDGPLEAHFYHVNGRHHSLAIARIPTRQRAFLHLMLETNSLDDVGIAHDICEERNVPITRTFGCHSNDRMLSFYVYTPSSFRIEYGYGGIDINDDLWVPRTYDKPSIWGHKNQHKELAPFMLID